MKYTIQNFAPDSDSVNIFVGNRNQLKINVGRNEQGDVLISITEAGSKIEKQILLGQKSVLTVEYEE